MTSIAAPPRPAGRHDRAAGRAGHRPRRQTSGDWPKGPIKIVVPFPPGGSTDPVARIIQAKLIETHRLEHHHRQQAGRHRRGRRGDRRQVAARRPDLDDHLRQPHPQSGLRAQPALQGLRPVQRHADRPHAAGDRARIPTGRTRPSPRWWPTRRSGPGKVSIGVLGASQALVLMTLIKKENDVDLNLIPYKGGGPLNQDILAGVTDVAIQQPDLAQPALPRQEGPADRRHRRQAHAGAARHADPDRAGREELPVLLVVGRLCAGRHAAADRRQACTPRSPRRCARPT